MCLPTFHNKLAAYLDPLTGKVGLEHSAWLDWPDGTDVTIRNLLKRIESRKVVIKFLLTTERKLPLRPGGRLTAQYRTRPDHPWNPVELVVDEHEWRYFIFPEDPSQAHPLLRERTKKRNAKVSNRHPPPQPPGPGLLGRDGEDAGYPSKPAQDGSPRRWHPVSRLDHFMWLHETHTRLTDKKMGSRRLKSFSASTGASSSC